MQEHELSEGWVCSDCMIILCNADWTGVPDDQVPALETAFNELDCHVSPGMSHDDCDHDDGDDLTYCETQDFSWSRCDICERPGNAGTRHAVTFWVNG